MRSFTDMMGREILLRFPPQRIVSVVPSQTELLYDLGLEDEVVGITKFCIHPESWFRSKTRVGGTKNLNVEKIISLRPDLVIANKEENTKEQIEQLARYVPVWISDIHTVDDGLTMIGNIGELVGRKDQASSILTAVARGFDEIERESGSGIREKVAYFIWRDPWMSAGGDTFIHDVLLRCGFDNVFGDERRYPEVREATLKQKAPAIVLLSSEPYPFKDHHIREIQLVLPDAAVKLVDGEMFSWYGSRMLKAADYLRTFIQSCT